MEKLYIIKIGGNVIDDEHQLTSFLKHFSEINGKKILVHGGGKIATAIGEKLGIASKYIDGRRITDDDTIDLVTMVYGGLLNKKLVAKLQALHVNAIGLSGADGNLLPAKKRPVREIDFGWVGDLNSNMDATNWKLLLENNFTPVAAPLTHDGQGNLLNTNADTIASVLAVALAKFYEVSLIYCFEKNGILKDISDENDVITHLNLQLYLTLKEGGQLFAGILPKIDNAFDAVNQGVKEVIIGNSKHLQDLTKGFKGTKILL